MNLVLLSAFFFCVASGHPNYLECNGLSTRMAANKKIMKRDIKKSTVSNAPMKFVKSFDAMTGEIKFSVAGTDEKMEFTLQASSGLNITIPALNATGGGLGQKCGSQVFATGKKCAAKGCTFSVVGAFTASSTLFIGWATPALIDDASQVKIASMPLAAGPTPPTPAPVPTPAPTPTPAPPTPTPAPPTPAPPGPQPTPAPPGPQPSPGPVPSTWECHTKETFANTIGLACHDGDKRASLAACKASCVAIPGCAVINFHDIDKHCHTCVGTVTHAQYEADIKKDSGYQTCMDVPTSTSQWLTY
jgi:hypothetical protein